MASKKFLTDERPELAAQWHLELNSGLNASEVGLSDRRKVWWLGDCGHEWQATTVARCGGRGCPVCAGKSVIAGENDLATQCPVVASQWHPRKNGEAKPSDFTRKSNVKVWWLCSKGHDYEARIGERVRGEETKPGSRACPLCSRANHSAKLASNSTKASAESSRK
mgnify:FL=1